MKAFYLEFAELDIETADEVLKDIATLVEQLGRLFIRQDFLNVLIWSFEVRE